MSKIETDINDLDGMIERALSIKQYCEMNDPKLDVSLLTTAIESLQEFQNKLVQLTRK